MRFFSNLQGARVQTLGVADDRLHQTEREAEERSRKRAKYFERQGNEPEPSTSHAR